MKKLKIGQSEKGLLFRNQFLEFFTKTSVLQAILIYGIIWLGLLYFHFKHSNLSIFSNALIYSIALISWTLFEYLAHRYLFHFVNENAWVKKIHYFIHGIHHQFPRDSDRLIMPSLPGLVIIWVLFNLFKLILGHNSYLFLAGFLNGWAFYVTIHYMIHAYKPIPGLKSLWAHHAKHHYDRGDKAFGVSSPFWDYVFGTLPD
jgi:sterol desaturase/sphingolipid hydroxylase (fatty acid hydroxylase superfamily)